MHTPVHSLCLSDDCILSSQTIALWQLWPFFLMSQNNPYSKYICHHLFLQCSQVISCLEQKHIGIIIAISLCLMCFKKFYKGLIQWL